MAAANKASSGREYTPLTQTVGRTAQQKGFVMGVSFSDVKESLTAIRHRLVDIREEVEWLEKYIVELEAAQPRVQADGEQCEHEKEKKCLVTNFTR